MKIARLMTIVTCAGLAAPALAQDSVSSTGAGDALDAYNTATQVVKFSTKLTPFNSETPSASSPFSRPATRSPLMASQATSSRARP